MARPQKPQGLKSAIYYVERVRRSFKDPKVRNYDAVKRLKMKKLATGTTESHTWGTIVSKPWKTGRNYWDYNKAFEEALHSMDLGDDVVSALRKIPRGNRTPLRVLDDGAGQGVFLEELSRKMKRFGIEVHSTAVSMHNTEELNERVQRGVLREVVRQRGEFYIPTKKYHAIFSHIGTLNYTINALKKDTLLKYANSLQKGGLLFVGFVYRRKPNDETSSGIANTGGLSEHPKQPREIKIEDEVRGIETALRKRGFEARFFEMREDLALHLALSNWTLVVRRLR
jgi:hypothetical protein